MTVQEDMRTFMMCVIQRGLAAIDYNVNIASEDGSAIAGSGRKWGKRERERGGDGSVAPVGLVCLHSDNKITWK